MPINTDLLRTVVAKLAEEHAKRANVLHTMERSFSAATEDARMDTASLVLSLIDDPEALRGQAIMLGITEGNHANP